MTGSNLQQYRGSLNAGQVSNGINAAARNCRRLIDDSKLLLGNQRYPSAASLAILAIEEAGKVSILREVALEKTPEERAKAWRRYRSHTKKNVAWILPQLVAEGAKRLKDLRPLFDEKSEHPRILDDVKQVGFYTDCLGKAHWSEPAVVVDEALARELVSIAEVLKPTAEVTTREIELWIKHVGPAWRGPMEWMKKALLNWRAEMVEEGLAVNDKGWEAFLEKPSPKSDS
jgi:AbiV family abortive infection protein